jgi:hypothetical protein
VPAAAAAAMALIYSLYIINKSGGLIYSRVRRRRPRMEGALQPGRPQLP